MLLVQISDTHLLAPEEAEPRARDAASGRVKALKDTVGDINRMDPPPDAVVHTGDLTHNGRPAEFALALDLLQELRAPFYVTAGNRDGRRAFIEAFSKQAPLSPDAPFAQYAIGDHALRLVAADTLIEGSNKGALCPPRLAHLDALLGAEPERPTVLFCHHPPFVIKDSKFPLTYANPEELSELAAVLNRHPQVRRILNGHSHRAAWGEIGGVSASSMPSVAVDLRMGRYPDAMAATPVYQVHQFDADTGCASRSHRVTGA